MKIKVVGHQYLYDITSISMLFFPGEKVEYVDVSNKKFDILSKISHYDSESVSITKIKFDGKWYSSQITVKNCSDLKTLTKQSFYKACSKATGIYPPWGILTGVRPLSVYIHHVEDDKYVNNIMKNTYYLTDEKIKLLDTIYNIHKHVAKSESNDVSVYISIPFCPAKCSYCSFISVGATNSSKLLDEYFNYLCKEITLKADIIRELSLNIKSVYIGGGTPGVLCENKLQKLLALLEEKMNISAISEVCFEIGRPETVTAEKFELLKRYGVTRICINTQTTNDNVLQKVNRIHTAADYFNAVKLASKYSFNSINTDLIAGLPGEDFVSFCKSLDDVIFAGVDNITIHTLAIKRAAKLSDTKAYYSPVNETVNRMLEYAYSKLESEGYYPYYIYRQKNCVGNGENIGFCKSDKICKYNIYMMEDVHSIIASGAGASSKIVKNGRVERIINLKYPMEYTAEFDKIIRNSNKLKDCFKVCLSDDQNTSTGQN